MTFASRILFRRCPLAFTVFLALAGTAVASVAEDARTQVRGRLQLERQRLESVIDGVGSRLPVPEGAADVVKVFGVSNDGQPGAAQSINQAIRAAAGRALFFPDGVYLLEDSIRPVSGTKLYLSPHAEMRRGFNGGNGDGRGALLQGPASFAVNDVTVVGGLWTDPDHRYAGRVITVIGSRWLIDSIRVTSWGPTQGSSSCMNLAGEDITVRNCVFTGSAGLINQDGIRVMCGAHIRVSDCYVESGDDCFCAFPTEALHVALSGRDLSDVAFERCFGSSSAARFLACGEIAVSVLLGKATMPQLNAVRVQGLRFTDCVGLSLATVAHAPAFFVVSADTNPGASVSDVRFTGCVGVGGRAAAQGALFNAAPGARCSNLTMEKCEIFGGQKEILTITRTCTAVRIVDCKLDGVASNQSR